MTANDTTSRDGRDERAARLLAGRIRYGGDYNPEQWPREVWREDVRLMVEAGVNLATVGVFSWAQLEPEEGRYDFDWLKEVLDLLGEAGIGVDLSTPTASPPPWLATRYPETLPVDAQGNRYHHGSRQHFCVHSPVYLRAALRIVEKLVEEVGGHEAIELWHVHNEYACHVPYCYCDETARAFRSWLEKRYGSLDALNDAWGTAFWSQRYASFAEVIPPRMTPTFANPGQELDFHRFSSDAFLDEMCAERAILRAARPDLAVTTNFMGAFKPLDYFTWARELDVVSTDNYQDPGDPDAPMRSALHYDLVRSLDKSAPWIVMEQSSSRVNWRAHNAAKLPGAMRAYSYQAVARGADGVLFFQWRASRAGAEKFHSAMVSHAGEASPVFAEVSGLGQELARLGSLYGTRVEASVALLASWPNWWAMEALAKPANDLTMVDQVEWMYRPLYQRGVTVDVCRPDEPLGAYDVLLVPSLYLLTEAEGANVVAHVEAGGTAVISFWSGIVDERDQVYLGPYGGPIRALFGCDVLEVAPLPAGEELRLDWADGTSSTAGFWLDVARATDGQVLASVADGPWAGRPAVVESRRGAGRVVYVATRLDDAGLARVYDRVPSLAPEPGVAAAGPGVERVVRRSASASFEILVNHSGEQRTVPVAPGGLELTTDRATGDSLVLGPRGVAVVRRDASR